MRILIASLNLAPKFLKRGSDTEIIEGRKYDFEYFPVYGPKENGIPWECFWNNHLHRMPIYFFNAKRLWYYGIGLGLGKPSFSSILVWFGLVWCQPNSYSCYYKENLDKYKHIMLLWASGIKADYKEEIPELKTRFLRLKKLLRESTGKTFPFCF